MPTDIPSASAGQEDFVKSEAIPVDIVLDRIRSRGNRVSILILDACRDNPFPKNGTRSLGGTRGLTRSTAPEGTFIMYSAGVGQTALDRLSNDDADPNSVFTRSLIPLLKQPGMSLIQTARQVRRDVQKLATTVSHDQRPAYYDEVTGDFFFAGRDQPVVKPVAQQPSKNSVAQAWSAVEDTRSKAILQAFIRRFPDSFYADFAKARLKELDQVTTALVRPEPPTLPKSGTRAPVHDCDRLAAHPHDPEAVSEGASFGTIDTTRALTACRTAVRNNPNEKRFAYQLARAQVSAKDIQPALVILERLAQEGYLAAQLSLGSVYSDGLSVTKDNVEAVKWFRKASEQDYAPAQVNLGMMYLSGRGVPTSSFEAVKWVRKAAEQDYVLAQYNLGFSYENGRGVSTDNAQAASWYRKAAEQDYALAQFKLGAMYERGQGVAKNNSEAAKWYRKAAEQDHVRAQARLGTMYDFGNGVAKNYSEAAKWYRKAADQDHARAQYNLGFMYENGQGVTKDDAEAVKWFSKAAAQDHPSAQYTLGVKHLLGEGGLPKNENKAAELVSRAIKSGHEFSITQMQDNARKFPKLFRVELQRILKDAGFYSGALDGSFGPATQAAIKKYAGKS